MLEADLAAGTLVPVLLGYEPTLSDGECPSVWAIFPNHHMLLRTRVLLTALIESMQQEE